DVIVPALGRQVDVSVKE
ncbi:hypothetical protein D046_2814B, partial [Vibrio parahaemolyticus V-223/04]